MSTVLTLVLLVVVLLRLALLLERLLDHRQLREHPARTHTPTKPLQSRMKAHAVLIHINGHMQASPVCRSDETPYLLIVASCSFFFFLSDVFSSRSSRYFSSKSIAMVTVSLTRAHAIGAFLSISSLQRS